jgi:hypothetical protein
VHDGGRAWKGYPWDVLDGLFERDLITDPKEKAKSVILTDDGIARAEECFRKYLAIDPPPPARRERAAAESWLPDVQRARIEALLAPICAPHPDPAVSSELRHGYRFERTSVILFESRPAFLEPNEWQDNPVAKFTFNKTRQTWQLYCMLRDLKWHSYEPLPESPDVGKLVAEVKADPTGIFWG